jgi:hypothetical protein
MTLRRPNLEVRRADGIVTYCVTIVSDPPGLAPLSLARERMEPERLRT